MIFVFIAGTYTPFALLALRGALGVAVLVTVWVAALVGLGLELAWIDAPRWVSAVSYLAVGWAGVILVPHLFPAVGLAAGILAVAGAVLYTLGAAAYATAWPNPFPATFGFHEVFHLLVVVAAAAQFGAVSIVVI
jgi:hemolysin III